MKILPDNIAAAGFSAPAPARGEAREGSGVAARLVSAGVAGFLLAGCSAAPVSMECRELQMRIDYADLSNDQLRFALQELEDCKRRLKDAQAKDSAFVEGAERRFTPDDHPPGEAGDAGKTGE
jgi:hypothetical protein